jgi:hypothetical protein
VGAGAAPPQPARCSAITCEASSSATRVAMPEPQSLPCAMYFVYPRRVINCTQIFAMRSGLYPRSRGLPEKPKPGIDGITTLKLSSTRPPYATGSVSGPITFSYSMIELGQPFSRRSGIAFAFFDFWWMK